MAGLWGDRRLAEITGKTRRPEIEGNSVKRSGYFDISMAAIAVRTLQIGFTPGWLVAI